MPRVLWPLLHDRPMIEVGLTRATDGQPLVLQLLADTGAGTIHSRFELLLTEQTCLLCGGSQGKPVRLSGAYQGASPRYRLRVQLPALGFDHQVRAAVVPTLPAGFDGLACFRFLNRFSYGNFGDPSQFGLET